MRMSRGITVTLLSGLMLTACLTTGGCGRRLPERTWYDAQGHAIAENWATDADGKRVPSPHPYDRYGRLWAYDSTGALAPLPPPAGPRYHPVAWIWGGSGYRSTSSGTSYRGGTPSPSPSVTHGGFGSTGAHISAGS
jgi:hypothetical protein